jgi:copper homeostasis protein (lipoprotein)
MPALRLRKTLTTLFFIIFFYLGCKLAYAESADQQIPHHEGKQLNLSGLYLGFFPCADCQGVRTTLALNKNDTYVLMSIYVGKSDREFVEKGKFTLDTAANKLILTPRKGSTTTQHYLIDGDTLIKLDENGERITQNNADGYVLKRKDVTSNPATPHSGH